MGNTFLAEPNKHKKIQKFQHRKLRAISCQMQGWRKNMQDAMLFDRISKDTFVFGVFDGHGGVQVAEYCSLHFSQVLQSNKHYKKSNYSQALQQAFMELDRMLDSQQGQKELREIAISKGLQSFNEGRVADSVGCTANVILVVDTKLYAANAGDSRAVLSRKSKLVSLSKDHKPDDQAEKMRIISAGGTVDKGRINSHLNLSRSIGDLHYKRNSLLAADKQIIIAKPDVMEVQLSKNDDFIIMGCDGVWQKFEYDPQGLIDLIRQERCKGNEPSKVLQDYFESCLAPNTKEYQNGCDNMTAVLIQFNKLLL